MIPEHATKLVAARDARFVDFARRADGGCIRRGARSTDSYWPDDRQRVARTIA
jgi:hypothetical protein